MINPRNCVENVACNPSAQEAEAGIWGIPVHLRLFKRVYLKKKSQLKSNQVNNTEDLL